MTDKKNKKCESQAYPNPDIFPAGLAVFEFGDTAELKYYNSALPGLFGYGKEEFDKKVKNKQIFCLEMKNAVDRKPLETAAESGNILENTCVVEKADSSAMWIFTSTRVTKESGRLVCSTLIYDVTLQKPAIYELKAERCKNHFLKEQLSALTFEYDPIADYLEIRSKEINLNFRSFRERFPQTEYIFKDDRAQFYWWLSLKDKECRQTIRFRADFDGNGYKSYEGVMSVICDKYGTPYHCTGVLR